MAAQHQIGFYNIVISFVTTKWTATLWHFVVTYPRSKLELLLTIIWDDICEPMWFAWNNIKFNQQNFATSDKISTLANILNWMDSTPLY